MFPHGSNVLVWIKSIVRDLLFYLMQKRFVREGKSTFTGEMLEPRLREIIMPLTLHRFHDKMQDEI